MTKYNGEIAKNLQFNFKKLGINCNLIISSLSLKETLGALNMQNEEIELEGEKMTEKRYLLK